MTTPKTASKAAGRIARTHVDVVDATATLDQPRIANAMAVMRETAVAAEEATVQRDALVRAMAAQMGYSLPADATDPDLIQRDISANMRRSVEAVLEVGRGLAVLKTACEHGQFAGRVEALGIEYRVAARFMQAAARFSNVSPATHLLKAVGTQSKLFELLVLDDDQVDELVLTGQTGDLALDDIACMTRNELRAAVKEAREELKAKDELLKHKNEQLDKERTKTRKFAKAPPNEQYAELRRQADAAGRDALGAVRGHVRDALKALRDAEEEHGDQTIVMASLLGPVMAECKALLAEFTLPDLSRAADAEAAKGAEAWFDETHGGTGTANGSAQG